MFCFACCLVWKVNLVRDAVRVSDETLAGFERWSSLANPTGLVDGFPGFHDTLKRWDVKYFEELVTSKDKDARTYFSYLQTHLIVFDYTGKESDEVINLAFNKKKEDA